MNSSLIAERFLRQAFGLAQATQVSTEALANIHTRNLRALSSMGLQTISHIQLDFLVVASVKRRHSLSTGVVMRHIVHVALSAASAIACISPASAQLNKEEIIEPSAKQMATLQRLTPDGVASLVVIKDDNLETITTLDTSRAYVSNGGFTDRVRSDNFIRAMIEKATGTILYQLYQNVRYTGDARSFTSVNFATDQGPVSVKLQTISTTITTCAYGLCVHEDYVGFFVPEHVLRSIASTYAAGASRPWRFRFKAPNGVDWEDRLMPAEVAGLLIATDRLNARGRR